MFLRMLVDLEELLLVDDARDHLRMS